MVGKKTKKIIKTGAKAVGSALDSTTGGLSGGIFGTVFEGAADRLLGGPNGLELLVDPWRKLPKGDILPSQLLRAEFQELKFRGRKDLIKDLKAWRNADEPTSVRLYTGAGGMGKTRLFIQVCELLRGSPWAAGFLTGEEGRISPGALDYLLEKQKYLFIVVDYAETRRDNLLSLLKQAAVTDGKTRIRIALIARDSSDWWTELCRADADVQTLLMQAPTPIPLPALAEGAAPRADIFKAALGTFAKKLGKPMPDAAPPDLNRPEFAAVLAIQMAALAALEGKSPKGMEDLLQYVLDHEKRYWEKELRSAKLPPELDAALSQAAALATLAGRVGNREEGGEEAQEFITAATFIPVKDSARVNRIASLLHDLYPGQGWLNGLQPDILGEYLVGQEAKNKPTLINAFFDKADETQAHNGLTVLTRLARRDPTQTKWLVRALAGRLQTLAVPAMAAAVETGDPVGKVLAEALKESPSPELAKKLIPLLPEITVSLRELNVEVTRQYLDELRGVPDPKPLEVRQDIAGYSANLAMSLSELGNRKGALKAARESETAFRTLAADHPEEMRQHHAMSLGNLANRLSELGRREEAYEAAKEAVDIRRQLAHDRPDAFLPDLALSLNTLSIILSDLGRREEAYEAAKVAADIHRQLAHVRLGAFLPYLALSLTNLAKMLNDLGLLEEAFETAKEAEELYRKLAQNRPDAFLPNLSQSLSNLANILSFLGRHEAAYKAAKEAVHILRQLAQNRPDAFLPNMALSLGALTNCLWALNNRDEALATIKEAVDIISPFFHAQPQAFDEFTLKVTLHYVELTGEMGVEAALPEPVAQLLKDWEEQQKRADAAPGAASGEEQLSKPSP